jgi:hypothetical protein
MMGPPLFLAEFCGFCLSALALIASVHFENCGEEELRPNVGLTDPSSAAVFWISF